MAKILLAAERKGGKISIRDAQLAFTSKFRPSAQMPRSWFGELVTLGYGRVEKSGKTLIFEIIPRSDDRIDQMPSNSIPATISATDLPSIRYDQLDQLFSPSDPTDPQLIHEVITSKPLHSEGSRSSVVSDHVINHPSEKIENQNVSDCLKFI